MSEPHLFGATFEETEVGRSWQGPGRTVTEADITFFAMLSGDWYPIHVDREYASKSWVGERIAHGLLTLALMSGTVPMEPGALEAFTGIDRCRFVRPVRIGDTIRSEYEIAGAERRDGSDLGRVEVGVTVRNQDDEVVVTATLLVAQRVGAP